MMQHPFQMDFIDMLRKDAHDVTVLTQARNKPHEKVRKDLNVIWFPWQTVRGRLVDINFFDAKNVSALISLIYNGVRHVRGITKEKEIDLVICLWIIPSGLYMYISSLLKMTRAPYVLWALGSDINKYRKNIFVRFLLKKIIRRSAHVFADGFELCAAIKELSGKDCAFLPTFRKIDGQPAIHKESGNAVSFLYVGRHAKVKGIDLLIDAVISLEKSSPELDYRVIIAGEGELTPRMMERVEEHGLNHRVIFEGQVSDDRLFALYSQADCVVIPSRSESIPVVFSEALQFNNPMIVTDVGDMGALGRRYGVARVIGAGNAAALAEALRKFVEEPFDLNPEKRNELLSLLMMENSLQKMLGAIPVGAK